MNNFITLTVGHYKSTLFSKCSNNRFFVYLFIFLISWLYFIATTLTIVQAQVSSGPISQTTKVSAFVADIIAPSTPILISPIHQSILNHNQPTFIWQGSSDNYALSHYLFYLNGNLWFDQIPLTETTEAYNLQVADNQYSLTPITKILSDGEHSWKIVAVDTFNNQTESASWLFSIDTKAPQFIITQVDKQMTSISSHDQNTVPRQPIIVYQSEVTIKANGEANSNVIVTASSNNLIPANYQSNIDHQGNWTINLANLPKNQIVYLDFLITDRAGNISVINQLPLIYQLPTTIPTIDIPVIGKILSPLPLRYWFKLQPQPTPTTPAIQDQNSDLPTPLISPFSATPTNTRSNTQTSTSTSPPPAPLVFKPPQQETTSNTNLFKQWAVLLSIISTYLLLTPLVLVLLGLPWSLISLLVIFPIFNKERTIKLVTINGKTGQPVPFINLQFFTLQTKQTNHPLTLKKELFNQEENQIESTVIDNKQLTTDFLGYEYLTNWQDYQQLVINHQPHPTSRIIQKEDHYLDSYWQKMQLQLPSILHNKCWHHNGELNLPIAIVPVIDQLSELKKLSLRLAWQIANFLNLNKISYYLFTTGLFFLAINYSNVYNWLSLSVWIAFVSSWKIRQTWQTRHYSFKLWIVNANKQPITQAICRLTPSKTDQYLPSTTKNANLILWSDHQGIINIPQRILLSNLKLKEQLTSNQLNYETDQLYWLVEVIKPGFLPFIWKLNHQELMKMINQSTIEPIVLQEMQV